MTNANKKAIALGKAIKAIGEAERKAQKLVKEFFPVGSEVRWSHGSHIRYGTVLENDRPWGLEVYIEGATGAKYNIDARPILTQMYGINDFYADRD